MGRFDDRVARGVDQSCFLLGVISPQDKDDAFFFGADCGDDGSSHGRLKIARRSFFLATSGWGELAGRRAVASDVIGADDSGVDARGLPTDQFQ